MKVSELFMMDFVNDETRIVINHKGRSISCGRWYQDHILSISDYPVLEFRYVIGDDRLYLEV